MPDNNDDTFLGGGIKFNSAGAGAPSHEPVTEIVPKGLQPHQIRQAIVIAVVVVMVAALFVVSIMEFGVAHGHGRHGVSPEQRPTAGSDKDY